MGLSEQREGGGGGGGGGGGEGCVGVVVGGGGGYLTLWQQTLEANVTRVPSVAQDCSQSLVFGKNEDCLYWMRHWAKEISCVWSRVRSSVS